MQVTQRFGVAANRGVTNDWADRGDATRRVCYISKRSGADSVIRGCTEIGLLIGPEQLSLPTFDSTLLHADAAIRFSLDSSAPKMPNGIAALNAAMA